MKKLPFLPIFITLLIGQVIASEVLNIDKLVAAPIIALALYWLAKYFGLTREDIGTTKVTKKTMLWSLAVMACLAGALGLIYLVAPDVFMDARYDQSLGKTMAAMFITLPLATVLLEEFAFRGLALGYLLKTSSKTSALVVSSALFGLWHIPSSLDIQVDSFLFIDHPPQLAITLAIILVTAAAGWLFSILRLKTGSLLVPIVAHWSLNAFAMLFAWLAWQR